jgi:GH25 family lysozyme M1 (1,4-beta-N-acetylmuramidase)
MSDQLLVDVSVHQDSLFTPSAWPRLAADPAYCGAILKATEGTGAAWEVPSLTWFRRHWPAVGATRLLRGAYHFLRIHEGGTAQARHFLDEIDRAGGWLANDLLPIVDVELSKANAGATRSEVERCTTDFAAAIDHIAGRKTILYAGAWLAELGITSRMGCSLIWYPAYVPTLDRHVYERIGWDEESLFAWQYAGGFVDGKPTARLAGYPATSPLGPVDLSVLTLPGGLARLRSLLWAERPG